jgi:DMSO/TMAO reductase YedYZ molybdopterin-dependent catalytic subunit
MPYRPSKSRTLDRSILKDALQAMPSASRRIFLRQSLSIGGLAMLTGCDLAHNKSVESALGHVSKFNDRAQAWLFDPNRLAPTYPSSMITRPFPFNAFYPESQITRHICVEGWSAIGQWGGVRFSEFLRRVGADTTAKYIGFKCADDYYQSIDMATALHPQTLLALTYAGQTLPRKYGFPMKLRLPTKLGYKNPKHIMSMFVTNQYPGGYWEDLGYNWFGGS